MKASLMHGIVRHFAPLAARTALVEATPARGRAGTANRGRGRAPLVTVAGVPASAGVAHAPLAA
jgi:hypothetical protein